MGIKFPDQVRGLGYVDEMAPEQGGELADGKALADALDPAEDYRHLALFVRAAAPHRP